MDKMIVGNLQTQLSQQDMSGLLTGLKEIEGKPLNIVSLTATELVIGSADEGTPKAAFKRTK